MKKVLVIAAVIALAWGVVGATGHMIKSAQAEYSACAGKAPKGLVAYTCGARVSQAQIEGIEK